ncbi:MAG: prepilin-type N-terminal cleavage/methylation domain-containing protein [Firmicutes bacterium]|nr:prepilin-type N-terminal cleavage/methylation domain-containing protein [Bacillota bacterium]
MREQTAEQGFSLIEVMVALAVSTLLMAIALPDFSALVDRAFLFNTTCEIVGDLRDQQALARAQQAYQEVRFAPFAPYYQLYSDGIGYTRYTGFDPGVMYEDGYLHLPQPTVRYNLAGNVNESGKIGLADREGDKQTIVVCLDSGELRFTHGLLGS